jgi:hypothetical protein
MAVGSSFLLRASGFINKTGRIVGRSPKILQEVCLLRIARTYIVILFRHKMQPGLFHHAIEILREWVLAPSLVDLLELNVTGKCQHILKKALV